MSLVSVPLCLCASVSLSLCVSVPPCHAACAAATRAGQPVAAMATGAYARAHGRSSLVLRYGGALEGRGERAGGGKVSAKAGRHSVSAKAGRH